MKSQTEIVTKEKRANSLPYFLPYIIFILNYYSPIKGGWFSYSVPLLAFGLIPLLDLWIGLDDWNPSPELARQLDKKISFRIVTWLWLPCQLFILVWTTNYICTHSLPISDLIGVTLGVGIVGGLGINCAHELIHKPNTFEQMLGKLLLVSVSYGHFYVEHLFGHHKRVSTIEDPATSRFGESFYSFWIRSVVGSFKSAWEIEKKRIESEGLPVFSIYNQVIQFTGTSFFLAYLFFLKFGICGFIFFVAQSILAFTLLEAVNYIEHYGLERKRLESGEFSRVTPAHSWNAGHRVTNYFLFKLQRHSDHHAYARRRYQILRSWKLSPQMPTGYAGMLLVALVPPLWFKIMNPRVQEVKQKYEEIEKSGLPLFVDPSGEDALSTNQN